MSWSEYYLVRHSDLYEYESLAKFVLSTIAMLVIPPPEEGQEPDPEEGWCVSGQKYIAAECGCSPEEVSRLTKRFAKDDILTVEQYRDKHGYPRCKYKFTDSQIEKLKARERKYVQEGHHKNPVRKKMKSARRKDGYKNLTSHKCGTFVSQTCNGIHNAVAIGIPPLDDSSKSLLTTRQEADRPFVKEPIDSSSIPEGLAVGVIQKVRQPAFRDERVVGRDYKNQSHFQDRSNINTCTAVGSPPVPLAPPSGNGATKPCDDSSQGIPTNFFCEHFPGGTPYWCEVCSKAEKFMTSYCKHHPDGLRDTSYCAGCIKDGNYSKHSPKTKPVWFPTMDDKHKAEKEKSKRKAATATLEPNLEDISDI